MTPSLPAFMVSHLETGITWLMGINGLLGIGLCFGGLRYWKVFLGITGAAVGFAGGVLLAAVCDMSPDVVLAAGVFGILPGCLLLARIEPLGTFVVGGLFGCSLWSQVVVFQLAQSSERITPVMALVVGIGVFVVSGIGILKSGWVGKISVSAIGGAFSIMAAAVILWHPDAGRGYWTSGEWTLAMALAGVGVVVQVNAYAPHCWRKWLGRLQRSFGGYRQGEMPSGCPYVRAGGAQGHLDELVAQMPGTGNSLSFSASGNHFSVEHRLLQLEALRKKQLVNLEEYGRIRQRILEEI